MTFEILAGSTGLEPAASGVTGRRYNRLNYDPAYTNCTIKSNNFWWAKRGSNPRHPACKAGALPAELFALEWRGRRDSNPRPPA